jgi:hypothetical protein
VKNAKANRNATQTLDANDTNAAENENENAKGNGIQMRQTKKTK